MFSQLENNHRVFQSAYKVYYSSETVLLQVHSDILQSLDKKQSIILGFLDLSAVFDTVSIDILLSTQFVKLNESSSSTHNLKTGIPQGSVLGPVLYLLYTAFIADIIKCYNFNYHIYADETRLYISFEAVHNPDSVKSHTENCISDIYRWMILHGLKLNQDKTIFSLIHSKFHPHPPLDHIQVGNDLIPFSTSATNLGVIFDETLSFEECEEHLQVITLSPQKYLQDPQIPTKELCGSPYPVLCHL